MSLRIITLAPVYALLSWVMMILVPYARFIEVARDVYETYSLYCFWYLLVLWTGGQREVTSLLSAQDGLCYLCPLLVPFKAGVTIRKFRGATGHFNYWRHVPTPQTNLPLPISEFPQIPNSHPKLQLR